MGGRDNHGVETSMTMTDERTKRLIELTWGKEGSCFSFTPTLDVPPDRRLYQRPPTV